MGLWRGWIYLKQNFLSSSKLTLLKLTSSIQHKARGKNHGLMSLYKDMESCGEYRDIQVMWEMIHASAHKQNSHNGRNKRPYWKFCFRSN